MAKSFDENVDEILAELDRDLGLLDEDAGAGPPSGGKGPSSSGSQPGVHLVGSSGGAAPRKQTPLQLALQQVANGAATLDLSHYSIRVPDTGMLTLATLLKQPSSRLSTVSLSSSDISPQGAATLWAALQDNKSITKLDMTNNTKMGDEGAKSMASALTSNGTLRWLDAENCGILATGGTAIADALRQNRGLESLHLSDNALTDACATRLAETLTVTAPPFPPNAMIVRSVDLRSKDQRWSYLQRVTMNRCQENTTLRILWLDNNKLTVKGADALKKGVAKSTTLQTVHLSGLSQGSSMLEGASGAMYSMADAFEGAKNMAGAIAR
jgi:hypothetical protein